VSITAKLICSRWKDPLNPAINTIVQAGTPVTFSGNSAASVTFAVASSPALLSSPDLDSGQGSVQPGASSYTLTSTKATATPGVLIYWDASFSNATLNGCKGLTPTTYTTSVRTLTVVSPPPTEAEVAAQKKQQEEAAAKKMQEEEEAAAHAVIVTGRACTVPSLKGNTLTKAQRILEKAHCQLGKITRPKARHHGQLVVTRQGVSAGVKLPSDTRIGVTLGRPLSHGKKKK
jgi:hypothetical protein